MSTCAFCGGDPEAQLAASWRFYLLKDPPTQNRIASNHGGARWAYKEARNDFEILATVEMRRLGIPRATRRRRARFTRFYSGRAKRRDLGNLIGGMKPVLDALVRVRLLVDDSDEWLEDHYRQERHDSITGILVELDEFAEPAP